MPKLPQVKPKQLIKLLSSLGFYFRNSTGNHNIYKHIDGRRVVVAVHNREIPKGTLLAILNDLKISKLELIDLL